MRNNARKDLSYVIMEEEQELPEELIDQALALSRQKFPDQPHGFPVLENFDWNAVQLPEELEQQLRDESDEDDVEALVDVTEESGFESVIVVDNLPVVAPEKVEKLTALIRKIFSGVGAVREGGFHMPFDEKTNKTKGFCFIEFEDPQVAVAARDLGHNHRLDKNHTFAVCMFDDIDRYQKVPDTYVPLEIPPYKPKENLYSYMLDERGRDQFVIRYKDETEISWWDGKKSQCDPVYKKSKLTDSFVQWSPQGTYLATAHRQGIAMWGGPDFQRFQRFTHPGVNLMDFSLCESFMTTYSLSRDRDGMPLVILRVFDVRTGALMRTFQGPPHEFIVGKDGAEPTPADLEWPLLKWAGGCGDKYFSKLGSAKNQQTLISVYETPEMVLLDKKSLKLEAVQAFEWSPSDPIMCIYQRESGNLPARISLMKIPERLEVRQKNLFSVKDIYIHWHPQGDFLAIRVNRHTKTKKTTYYGFELFRIREKDVPMEVLELPNKTDRVIAFAWEPQGKRFAVAHGTGPKFNVTFYSMFNDKGKAEVVSIGTLEGKIVEQLHWSPKGSTIIFAGPAPAGQLEFFNVELFETMNTGEHYMMTDLLWDPSGRYVSTATTSIRETDNGYNLWTFQGRSLLKEPLDRFFQFSWRPRRPSLLSAEKKSKIETDLKTYSKRYDAEDEILLMAADTEIAETRTRQMNTWKSWISANGVHASDHQNFLLDAYGEEGYAEAEFEMKMVELQQIVDIKEENYKPSFGF